MTTERLEEKETARTEAFSDGIFAFAITLLVLNLKDPVLEGSVNSSSLLPGLLNEWPSLFALVMSFGTILIMWVNHHDMFDHINRVDTPFLFFNGLVLFFVVLTPFTTSLVAQHSLSNDSDARTAAAIYSGAFLLLAIVWNWLWYYSSHKHRLLARNALAARVKSISFWYFLGPVFYTIAFTISLVSPILSVVAILLVAVYFALNTTVRNRS